jgi:predicted DNA-binding transcriptional regulator AlpA
MTDDVSHDISLMRARDVRRALAIGRSTVWRWVAEGRLPPPIRMGRVTAWRRSDIANLLDRLAREQAA